MQNLSDDHVSPSSLYLQLPLLKQPALAIYGICNMEYVYVIYGNIIYPRGYSIAKRTLISFRTFSFENSPVESLMFSNLSLMVKFNIDY